MSESNKIVNNVVWKMRGGDMNQDFRIETKVFSLFVYYAALAHSSLM